MSKPYKYKGVLATPIGNSHWLVPIFATRIGRGDPAYVEEAEKTQRRKIGERIEALCDEFDIPRDDPNMWQRLAMALATRYVGGFSSEEPKRKGPKGGSILKHHHMARLVDERIAKRKMVSPAVRAVAKQLGLKNSKTAERDYRRFKEWEATTDAIARKAVEKSRRK